MGRLLSCMANVLTGHDQTLPSQFGSAILMMVMMRVTVFGFITIIITSVVIVVIALTHLSSAYRCVASGFTEAQGEVSQTRPKLHTPVYMEELRTRFSQRVPRVVIAIATAMTTHITIFGLCSLQARQLLQTYAGTM